MRLANIDIRTHTSHSRFRSWSMPRMVLVADIMQHALSKAVAITFIVKADVYLYIHVLPDQFLFKLNTNNQFEKNMSGKHGHINLPSTINFLATALAMLYYL